MQVRPSVNLPAATDPAAPPRPPERQRDTLEGLLEATLFPTVKGYRASILDILRVINETQIGRELLQDFRTLAARGRFPSIDLVPRQHTLTQQARRTHCLLLREDLLAAGAMKIGVAPELEYAPSVLFRLTEIRNVLAAEGKDNHYRSAVTDVTDVPMDPVDTGVRFRAELAAREAVACRTGDVGAHMDTRAMLAMRELADNTRATPPAPTAVGNERATPPVRPPRGNEPAVPPAQMGPGIERTVQPADTSFDGRSVPPLPQAPPSKLSTTSNPYVPVTESVGTSQDDPPVGGPRRALRWAGQHIQAMKDFFLRRGDDPGADGHRNATTDAQASQERPIIREAKGTHRRTQSIRHKREVDPDHGREQADTSRRASADTAPGTSPVTTGH